MKKFSCVILIFVIATSLISFPVLGQVQALVWEKWIRQSEIHPRIHHAADQGESVFGNFQTTWYFDGARDSRSGMPEDGWVRSWLRNSGSRFGCRNWRDPATGEIVPIKLGGAPYGTGDATLIQFPIADSNGITIKKYFRYYPPAIIVDGLPIQRAFPTIGDYYAPDKVWGTADVMVQTHSRNWLGLDIYQTVLSWVSKRHNQYVIYDWTIVNTGNVDYDDSLEREGESLDSLYFVRQLEMTVSSENEQKSEWYTWTGVFPDWDEPADSVRCLISYPALEWDRYGYSAWGDALGSFSELDYLDDASSGCEVYLYVPQSPDVLMGPGSGADNGVVENYPETDDVTQPRAHGFHGPDDFKYKHNSNMQPVEDWNTFYNTMIYGEKGDPLYDPYVEYMTGTYPGTYHPVPTDRRGASRWNDMEPDAQVVWHIVGWASMGPFDLEWGDTLRIVWANCGGRLSEQTAWEVGNAWKDSSITFVTRDNDTLTIDDIDPSQPFPDYLSDPGDSIYMPPVYKRGTWSGGWRWQDPGHQCDRANLLKDMWVYSTVDSVIRHAINAQWNFDHSYMVPVPPPPPSIEVNSGSDRINISWWYEQVADEPSDLAGFKIYRSVGRAGPMLTNYGVAGVWELIFQSGGSDPGGDVVYNSEIVYEYSDTSAIRGESYYYYVASFDDGTHPETPYPGGVKGTPEVLESGRWQNYTYGVIGAASLKRPCADNLDSVRVVPNPFNITSRNMQYGGGSDRINFFNLPGNCTIRIYTLTGDLLTTIEHNDGSGDEPWDNPTRQLYQVTDGQQHVVSGLYIANIIDNENGESTNIKFVVIR